MNKNVKTIKLLQTFEVALEAELMGLRTARKIGDIERVNHYIFSKLQRRGVKFEEVTQ
jgi:hypothetical protein